MTPLTPQQQAMVDTAVQVALIVAVGSGNPNIVLAASVISQVQQAIIAAHANGVDLSDDDLKSLLSLDDKAIADDVAAQAAQTKLPGV